MNNKQIPSEIRDYLCYDQASGLLKWIKKPATNVHVGSVAGNVRPDGYVQIRFKGSLYFAHRIAWYLMHGECPTDKVIDHIDCNPSNNAANNIRLTTPEFNTARIEGRGYRKVGNRYEVQVGKGSNYKYVGMFSSKEEAVAAYNREKEAVCQA